MSYSQHKDGRIEHSFDELNDYTELEYHHPYDCVLACELPNGKIMYCDAVTDGEGGIEYIKLDTDLVRNARFEHDHVTSVEALDSFGIERVTLLLKCEVEGFDHISSDIIE